MKHLAPCGQGRSSVCGSWFSFLSYDYPSYYAEESEDDPSEEWRRVAWLVIHFTLQSEDRTDGSTDRWHLFLQTISGKMSHKA